MDVEVTLGVKYEIGCNGYYNDYIIYHVIEVIANGKVVANIVTTKYNYSEEE